MESLVNFENLKELIYYYAISDRNGISILNKNLEKENYTKLIQETCVELFKRDYNIGIISNKQGEYCNSYPEKIVILESEKQEDEKEDNNIVKIEDIRERIFKGNNRVGEKKKKKEKVKQERNSKGNKEESNAKLSIKTVKRKNSRTEEEEEEEEHDIISSGFFSPKKTQKNSFWEERRNSISKNSVTNLSLPNTCYFQPPPSLLSPQSHPNDSVIKEKKKNDQKIEREKNNNDNNMNMNKNNKKMNNNNNNNILEDYGNNLNFDNISYDGVNVDDNNSYSFVSYGNLSSPKNEQGLTAHLNSPNTFIKSNSAKEQERGNFGLEPN